MLHAQISRMVRSMVWADEQVIGMLGDRPPSQADGVPLLAHVLGAEHHWLTRLQQRQPSHPVWPTLSLAECAQLASQNAAGFLTYLGGTPAADLGTRVRYQNSKGVEQQAMAIDILTHAVIHGAYHRGQIARVLKQFGVQAATTDFMAFAQLAEPATTSLT